MIRVLNFQKQKMFAVIMQKSFHEICPKGADVMANSVDPDQIAPLYMKSLIWVCSVCQVMSVQKLRTITVLLVLIFFVVYVV